MKSLLNKLAIFTIIFTFYIISTGSIRMFTILFGIIISALMAVALDRMLLARAIQLRDLTKIVYLLQYLVYFIYAAVKSHIEVARIILMDSGRLRPSIIAIPYTIESDYGLTLLALSITNTPGTLTLYVDKQSKILFIHWIETATLDAIEARKIISGKFEELAKKIFG
ncbi:MAG: Na+/H+ antiporter subunit E [Ignisphaera sp.]